MTRTSTYRNLVPKLYKKKHRLSLYSTFGASAMRINNDYWRAILSAIKVAPETGVGESSSGPLQKLIPGQQVNGEVMARLSDQVYLLKIAGEIYRTELPVATRPGTNLTLTFRTGEPRPEFLLQSPRSEASPVTLSPTAASLLELLKRSSTQSSAQAVKSLELLFTSEPANTSILAASLRNALSFSGIFYESHLVQWFLGERLFTDIQRESRLRLAAMVKKGQDQAAEKTAAANLNLLVDTDGSMAAVPKNKGLPDRQLNISALSDPLTSSLLREQLETLVSGIFRWQGTVWQDQEMEWEVEKQNAEKDNGSEHPWRTSIHLCLPKLGSIHATLVFSEKGIIGRITTDSPATKDQMKRELGSLGQSMADSGLTLREMVISHDKEG
ncbi:MAG: flagellar hook-length control protein FliK [Deltaproteobacteria bacterium]|nr:flagellar hook-length control protein FliK [Deltaproteobacteria bacterium]